MMKMIRSLAIVSIALGLVVACAKKEESATAPVTETAPVPEVVASAAAVSEAAVEASADAAAPVEATGEAASAASSDATVVEPTPATEEQPVQ